MESFKCLIQSKKVKKKQRINITSRNHKHGRNLCKYINNHFTRGLNIPINRQRLPWELLNYQLYFLQKSHFKYKHSGIYIYKDKPY